MLIFLSEQALTQWGSGRTFQPALWGWGSPFRAFAVLFDPVPCTCHLLGQLAVAVVLSVVQFSKLWCTVSGHIYPEQLRGGKLGACKQLDGVPFLSSPSPWGPWYCQCLGPSLCGPPAREPGFGSPYCTAQLHCGWTERDHSSSPRWGGSSPSSEFGCLPPDYC